MRSPLNKTTAPQVVRLFDMCFRQGIFDAAAMEDNYAVQEFYDRLMETGGYGILGEPTENFDWKRWQHALYRIGRYGRLGSVCENYIDKIHRFQNTFVFVLLPLSQRFYLEGIREWLNYPNPNALALFKSKKKFHWDPSIPSHLRNITTADYISMVQTFVYERQDKAFEKDLSSGMYDHFANAIWRLTQKYPILTSDDEDVQSEA